MTNHQQIASKGSFLSQKMTHLSQKIPAKSPAVYRWFLYSLAIFSTFSIAGSDGSILFLYLICLLNIVVNRHYWRVPRVMWYGFLVYIICVWFSGVVSPYEKGGLVALNSTWRLYLPFVLFLTLKHVNLSRWLQVLSIFVFIIAVYGIIQFFTGADWFRSAERSLATPYHFPALGAAKIFHAKGNFSHHLTYGGYLLLIFPTLAMLACCLEVSKNMRRWYGLVTFLVFGAILFSLARSIWLGSAAALYLLSFRFSRKIPIILGVMGGLLFMFMIANYTLKEETFQPTETKAGLVWQRFTSGFMLVQNQDRLLMWESGWDAIKDHIFWGIGPKNNAEALPKYRQSVSQRTGHQFFNSASAGVHNIYLQIWLYSGIFGLVSYLAIWVLFLHHNGSMLLRSPKGWGFHASLLLGGIAGIVGFLVAGIFENNFLDGEVQIAVMLVFGLSLYSRAQMQS